MAAALATLQRQLAEKDELIEAQSRRLDEQAAKMRRMQQQLEELLRSRYGRKSEKLDINQLLIDGIILGADGQAAPDEDPTLAPAAKSSSRPKSRHKGRCPLPDHLPRHEIIIEAPESEKTCPVTGESRPFIGYEESPKLEYIPETLRVNVYKREKYGSPMGAEENGVYTAPLPPALLERCLADTGMLAYVAVSKFDDHLPLYRLERMFLRQGVELSRKTMTGWLAGLGANLAPLRELLGETILASGVVLHDDTPVKMLDPGAGKTKETRLWVAVSGSGPPLVHFSFSRNRKQQTAVDFFRHYSGALMCDEYGGYANCECGHLLSCWAHARRYVEKAQNVEPAFATEVLLEIARLYKIESRIAEASEEDRTRVRASESREQLKRIFGLLESREFRPQSPMHRAAHYILHNRKTLSRFTENPLWPIDNNAAERAIRRVAVGRKNWLFLGSETGGQTAAVLMTLLGTCWANRINAWAYLKDVLDRMPTTPKEQYHQLLPHIWIQSHPEARLPAQK